MQGWTDATWLLLEPATETPEVPSTYRRHLANILSQVMSLFNRLVLAFVFPFAVRYNMGTNDSSLISACLFEPQTTYNNKYSGLYYTSPLLEGAVKGSIQAWRLKMPSPHRIYIIGRFSKNHTPHCQWRHSTKYVPAINSFKPTPCFAHYWMYSKFRIKRVRKFNFLLINCSQNDNYIMFTGAVSGGRGLLGKCGGVNNPTHYTR